MSNFTKHTISSEQWREYVYSGGHMYHIPRPKTLYVKNEKEEGEGPSHRVVDHLGVTHRPERGWVAIRWRAPDEEVSF